MASLALGRREESIEKLLDALDTYLDRPVCDHYWGLPEGTKTVFGRDVSSSVVRGAGGMTANRGRAASLSCGQMQRLAV